MVPTVSVILPVYNGEKYLREALESILAQSCTSFELLAIDDGSLDDSAKILREYQARDERIRLQLNTANRGLVASLNIGIQMARGTYLARMDQDDISLPYRLQKQVEFMDAHPEIGICGSWVETIGDPAGHIWHYPEDHDAICANMLFNNSLVHPSVMIRSQIFREHDLKYDPNAAHAEDYDLWSRAFSIVHFANLPEVLLYYRVHPANTAKLYSHAQQLARARVHRQLLSRFGLEVSDKDLVLHGKVANHEYSPDPHFLMSARAWLEKLLYANRKAHLISQRILLKKISQHWSEICMASAIPPMVTFREIVFSQLPFQNMTGLRKIWRALRFYFDRITSH